MPGKSKQQVEVSDACNDCETAFTQAQIDAMRAGSTVTCARCGQAQVGVSQTVEGITTYTDSEGRKTGLPVEGDAKYDPRANRG